MLCIGCVVHVLRFNKITFLLFHAEHPWLQNAKKAPNVPLGETVKARLKQFSVMNKLKKRALRVIIQGPLHYLLLLCNYDRSCFRGSELS